MATNRGGKPDINTWEKRLCLYLITVLVGVATEKIIEMNTTVRVMKTELVYNREIDDQQTKDIYVLEEAQQEIKMDINNHELRLCGVEERLKMKSGRGDGKVNITLP